MLKELLSALAQRGATVAARPLAARRPLPLLAFALVLSQRDPCPVLLCSPLKGQGTPEMNTKQVFLSIRLERLLDGEGLPLAAAQMIAPGLISLSFYPAVDDYKFRHENVATYWLSWFDPTAENKIRDRTASLTAGKVAWI